MYVFNQDCLPLLFTFPLFVTCLLCVVQWSLYCAYNIRLERCVHYDFGMHPLQAGEQSTDHSVSVETVLQGNETTPVAVTVEHAALTQSGSSAPLIMSSSPGVQYCLREEIGCTRFVPTVCHADLVQRSLLPSNDAARDGRGSVAMSDNLKRFNLWLISRCFVTIRRFWTL